MTDVVTPQKRSQIMAGIKGKDTSPELAIRSGLHKSGFRFRIHDKKLSGKPDIVLAKWHAVIFVNGCFWHFHDCYLFKMPASNIEFWEKKLSRNKHNDHEVLNSLEKAGWRICIVWECSLKGKLKYSSSEVLEACMDWLKSDRKFFQIRHK